MANTIQHKRSSTASVIPSSVSLAAGELAINTADGKLYLKKDDASVIQVGGPAEAGTITGATLASNVLASSLTSVGTLANLTVTNTISGSINGNAATATTATNVTTNANLTGAITSSGNATVLGTAAFSSANLASAVTDETGTGALVFATSPTLVTPALGTPSALVGTNISGTGASFTAGTATNAINVAITSDNTATSYFVPFVTAATGNNGLKADTGTGGSGLTYVPSTATLTTGNVIATGATLQTLTSAGDLSITTANGSTNDVTVAPFGIITLSPTSSLVNGGSAPSVVVNNSDLGAGLVTVAGGDLYLSTKYDDVVNTQVNIIFEGATANNFETTLTVTDPTADRTITLPNATGTVALTTDLSQFAATSSAQLATLISDETGSGALVFATSPTLVTPALGTPSALVGTNISGTGAGFTAGTVTTNANLTGAITSSGNATVLGTAAFSSANLAGALTDETGSGAAVFATSPTLVTPALGAATATSLTAGNTGVKVGEHVSRFLTITSDGSNSSITQNGNSESTLSINHSSNASIYIGDSDGNNNNTYIDVNDGDSTITLNGSVRANEVTADAYILSSSGIPGAKTASYTLVATDNGKIITMNVATANNLTVPASLAVGFNCTIIQIGAGQTTIVASGTTLNSYQGYLKISGQHGSASIVSYVSNVYNVAGSLSA